MSPELEQMLIKRLSEPKGNNYESPTDRLGALFDDLKKKNWGQKLEQQFMQVIDPETKTRNNPEFEQGLTSVFKKEMLAEAFGASISGQVGGMVGQFMGGAGLGGLGIGIGGINSILGGWAMQKYLFKTGTGNRVGYGVMLGGTAVAIAGFTGGLNLGGLLGGRNGGSPAGDTTGVTF